MLKYFETEGKYEKNVILQFFLIISILVILGIVKKIQNIYEFPYLYVISDDKKWKAYAYPAYEGGQWTGEMFFFRK